MIQQAAAKTFLQGIRPIEATYNARLQARLIGGDCLKALLLPPSRLTDIDKLLKRLRTSDKLVLTDEYQVYNLVAFAAADAYVDPCKA